MSFPCIRILFSAIIAALSFSGFAATAMKLPADVRNPVVDGKVVPEEIAAAANATMTLLGGFDKPKWPTQVYTRLCPEGLYVGFVCSEPDPAKAIVSTQAENGAVFEDDSVQLLIVADREATSDNYMHFAVNAKGVRYSNRMDDNVPLSGWKSAVSTGDQKWEAEILIPSEALKGPDSAKFWRCNFARMRASRGAEPAELSAWVNTGATLHNPKAFGFLQLDMDKMLTIRQAAAQDKITTSAPTFEATTTTIVGDSITSPAH